MRELRELNLSFNRISTLEGLDVIHGESFSLQNLDLRNNSISDAHQYFHLVGLCVFYSVFLQDDF